MYIGGGGGEEVRGLVLSAFEIQNCEMVYILIQFVKTNVQRLMEIAFVKKNNLHGAEICCSLGKNS